MSTVYGVRTSTSQLGVSGALASGVPQMNLSFPKPVEVISPPLLFLPFSYPTQKPNFSKPLLGFA